MLLQKRMEYQIRIWDASEGIQTYYWGKVYLNLLNSLRFSEQYFDLEL